VRTLKFVGPTLMPSLGETFSTVRKGAHWANLDIGDNLSIICCAEQHGGDCGAECEDFGLAEVLAFWAGQLVAIPASILEYEHEPLCHTYYGLRARLREVYGVCEDPDECVGIILQRTG
jgi:hypothetical protein